MILWSRQRHWQWRNQNTHLRVELSKLEGENINLKQANEKLQAWIKELEETVHEYKPKVVNQKMKRKQTSVKHWTQTYRVANRRVKKQADLSQQLKHTQKNLRRMMDAMERRRNRKLERKKSVSDT